MDFFVVLERPGYRVGRRRRCKARVGIQHRVTKEDAMKWFQVNYEGVILNKLEHNCLLSSPFFMWSQVTWGILKLYVLVCTRYYITIALFLLDPTSSENIELSQF